MKISTKNGFPLEFDELTTSNSDQTEYIIEIQSNSPTTSSYHNPSLSYPSQTKFIIPLGLKLAVPCHPNNQLWNFLSLPSSNLETKKNIPPSLFHLLCWPHFIRILPHQVFLRAILQYLQVQKPFDYQGGNPQNSLPPKNLNTRLPLMIAM